MNTSRIALILYTLLIASAGRYGACAASQVTFELLGQWEAADGSMMSAALHGNHAYIAEWGVGVHVVLVTGEEGTAPTKVGGIYEDGMSHANDITTAQSHLLVSIGDAWKTESIAEPASSYSLKRFTLEDPHMPSPSGEFCLADSPDGLFALDECDVFAFGSNLGFLWVRFDPLTGTPALRVDVGLDCRACFVEDVSDPHTAFLASGHGIVTLDLSLVLWEQPGLPNVLGYLRRSCQTARDLFARDGHLYVVGPSSGRSCNPGGIVDVTQLTQPNWVFSSMHQWPFGLTMKLVGDHAFIGSYQRLVCLNVLTPTEPVHVGEYWLPDSSLQVLDVDVQGDLLCLTTETAVYFLRVVYHPGFLRVREARQNILELQWNDSGRYLQLEHTDSLVTPVWIPWSHSVSDSGAQLPITGDKGFYRLATPQ